VQLIAYYYDQEGNYYRERASRLAEHCLAEGIPHTIKAVEANGWLDACAAKPRFIMETLQEHNEPVLYIDVDSPVSSSFHELHEPSEPIGAARNLRWGREFTWYASSVLYAAPLVPAIEFLARWIAANEASLSNGLQHTDHECLNIVIDVSNDLPFALLPKTIYSQDGRGFANTGVARNAIKQRSINALRKRPQDIRSITAAVQRIKDKYTWQAK